MKKIPHLSEAEKLSAKLTKVSQNHFLVTQFPEYTVTLILYDLSSLITKQQKSLAQQQKLYECWINKQALGKKKKQTETTTKKTDLLM